MQGHSGKLCAVKGLENGVMEGGSERPSGRLHTRDGPFAALRVNWSGGSGSQEKNLRTPRPGPGMRSTVVRVLGALRGFADAEN